MATYNEKELLNGQSLYEVSYRAKLPNLPGIYIIENIINGKVYIGSTKNISHRIKDHIYYLSHQKHSNIKLQNSFNKNGLKNFYCYYILTENYLNLEQHLLNALNFKYNYNIGKKALGGDNISEHPDNNQIRKKISKASKNKWTKERKQAMSNRNSGKLNPNYGGKITKQPEIKAKISKARKELEANRISPHPLTNRIFTNETKQKMSESAKKRSLGPNNNFYGRNHSDAAKYKMKITRGTRVEIKTMCFYCLEDAKLISGLTRKELEPYIISKKPRD